MNGGTSAHWVIQGNLFALLKNGLGGKRCQPYPSGMKIRTAVGFRYPDAFVVCSRIDPAAQVIDDPVVVFEIVSPGSETTDHIDKNHEYAATSSIQRYVILEQSMKAATVFARHGDDWSGRLFLGDVTLALPEIDLSLAMADIYAGALPDGGAAEAERGPT
jgi:Uma2 family endonuclease